MVEVLQVGRGKFRKEESENATYKTITILTATKIYQTNKETNLITDDLLQPAQQK